MASSPKKAAKPAAVVHEPQTPAPALAFEAPAAPAPAPAAKVEAPKLVVAPKTVEAPKVAKELQDSFRAMAEKGIVATRTRYAEAKTAAQEVSAAVEASYGAAQSGVAAFNVKALEAIQAGADANFGLFKSLASVKSFSEIVTLQTEFARKQFEAASTRAKELTELARKVADETAAPIKAQVAKSFKLAV